jgi:hypothetical protein
MFEPFFTLRNGKYSFVLSLSLHRGRKKSIGENHEEKSCPEWGLNP